MSERILVDTGFWIALYDKHDQHHEAALVWADLIDEFILVFPWPALYEVLRTQFVKRPESVAALDERLSRSTVRFIEDGRFEQKLTC